jgi:hypothetical protein
MGYSLLLGLGGNPVPICSYRTTNSLLQLRVWTRQGHWPPGHRRHHMPRRWDCSVSTVWGRTPSGTVPDPYVCYLDLRLGEVWCCHVGTRTSTKCISDPRLGEIWSYHMRMCSQPLLSIWTGCGAATWPEAYHKSCQASLDTGF